MPKKTTKHEELDCAFCGRAATRLCDYVIGFEIDPEHTKWPVAKSDGEMFTCDAPLCPECCTNAGMTTITGVPEQIDHCPHHAHCVRPRIRNSIVTKHEAERLRILAWKRKLFVEVET